MSYARNKRKKNNRTIQTAFDFNGKSLIDGMRILEDDSVKVFQDNNYDITKVEALVHGAYKYRCDMCGKETLMWLEIGVEQRGDVDSIPCPYMINCKCGGFARHVDWNKDIHLPRPMPVADTMNYFKYNKNIGHGVPILREEQ